MTCWVKKLNRRLAASARPRTVRPPFALSPAIARPQMRASAWAGVVAGQRGPAPGVRFDPLSRTDSLEENARPLPGGKSPAQQRGAEARMPRAASAQRRSVALL